MNNIDLIAAFADPLAEFLLKEYGYVVDVAALNQPTQQGRTADGRGVYFQFLFDNRMGTPQVTYVFDQVAKHFDTTETQNYLGKVQISVLWPQDPETDFDISAIDVANQCARFMNSRVYILRLRSKNIGVTKISSIRPNPISNDRDQFEYMPTFDIDFSFNGHINYVVDKIDAIDFEIHKV